MEKEWFKAGLNFEDYRNVKVAYVNLNGRTFQIKPMYKDDATEKQHEKESDDLRLHVKELFRR